MAYLIYTQKRQLLLINDSMKNGLYSQTLSPNGLSRPLSIHRGNPSQYSATVDHHQNLHIVTQPSPDQIIHLHYKDNNVLRDIILEDPKGIYHFSNLYVTTAKEQVHLFYTANQPIGQSRDLIHHILCTENKTVPQPIISFSSTPFGLRYLSHHDEIYILYGEMKDEYSLYLMAYKNQAWETPQCVSSSSFPIDDFQFCIDHQKRIHLVYVQEKYGRYHLLYRQYHNNMWAEEILLTTTSSSISPSLFTYHQGIWVTYLENDHLQMILSMDQGHHFSQSVSSSMEGKNLKPCHFIAAPNTLPDSFNGNRLYASLTSSIRIGVIAYIDMIGLHPDMVTNTELELFLDGVFFGLTQDPSPKQPTVPDLSDDLIALQKENEELKQIQQQMVEQYNDMTELTKKIQAEGKKWRDRAQALEQSKSQGPSV